MSEQQNNANGPIPESGAPAAESVAAEVAGESKGIMGMIKSTPGNIKANFSHGGFVGKAKVAVGAIGVLDALRRVWNGVAADPEKGESRWGNIGVGVIEGGLALAAAGHGGGKLVRG